MILYMLFNFDAIEIKKFSQNRRAFINFGVFQTLYERVKSCQKYLDGPPGTQVQCLSFPTYLLTRYFFKRIAFMHS